MKRVLRSCLEPLPRFVSTKSLAAIVTIVLVGTAVSVFEYLESARPPVRRAALDSPCSPYSIGGCSESRACDASSTARQSANCPCPRGAIAPAAVPAPAGSRTLERASDAASEGRSAAPSSFEPDLGSLHG